MREAVAAERAAGRTIAFTPTLGALHDGHLAHVVRAAELADIRVVSIFVNPTQFTQPEDLERYPRTLEADVARLAEHGVDYVFAPDTAQMYPSGPTQVTVRAGDVGGTFEGKSRPGHFDGVLTVVAKLFGIVTPDVATFGQKDAQQLFLVQRMVADLDFAVRIEAIETVREDDGLAMSSRNRFLSPGEGERRVCCLPRSRRARPRRSAASTRRSRPRRARSSGRTSSTSTTSRSCIRQPSVRSTTTTAARRSRSSPAASARPG